MESRDRVTKRAEWHQVATGYPSGPFLNDAERVIFVVHGGGNVQGDFKRPNPNSFTKTIYKPNSGSIITRKYQGGVMWTDSVSGQITSGLPGWYYPAEPEWAQMEDENWGKVYDKIRGGNNLIVDLAESAQTITMLRNTTKMHTVMGEFFARNPLPRRITRWQERLDYLTGKWLEYRYGWMPLVYSTFDAMETLANKVVVDPDVWVRVRTKRVKSKTFRLGNGSWNDPSQSGTYEQIFRLETKVNFMLPGGLGVRDWTSLNPLGIAWELLPLSFVADWFVNVGDQLSLWENWWSYSSQFRGGYSTQSSKRTQSLKINGASNYPIDVNSENVPYDGVFQRHLSVSNSIVETHKSRVVHNTIPFPNGFRFEVKLNAKRLLDSASLLHQLVGKKFR